MVRLGGLAQLDSESSSFVRAIPCLVYVHVVIVIFVDAVTAAATPLPLLSRSRASNPCDGSLGMLSGST